MNKVFAVKDVKADAFGAPICCPTVGIAKRTFLEACTAQGSPMAQYPEDFMLYEIGSYDPAAGRIEGLATPVFVASAVGILDAAGRRAAPAVAPAGEVVA